MISFAALWVLQAAMAAADEPADYVRDVKPILRNKCWSCHGAVKQEANLRLDAGRFLHASKVVEPGRPEKSELIRRVTAADANERMPAEGAPLSDDQVAVLKAWIAEGAKYPADEKIAASPDEHWAFQPIRRPDVPAVEDTDWPRNPIDRFVLAKLEARGWKPNPPAEPWQLLRRASLDLVGLPPTIEEIEAFAADPNYDQLVDKLLNRKGYGERYARHWLDVVRYADSNGYERDAAKPEVWRYRDYVIRSLNDDKPFDRFVVEQLAGDEMPDADTETVIATGFYRLGPWDDEPADFAVDRFDQLDDIVNTASQAFLGLTMGCARCHDHKFDPLLQQDYYSLVAVFDPLKRPQNGRTELTRYAAPPALAAKLDERDRRIDAEQAAVRQIRAEFITVHLESGESNLPPEARSAFLTEEKERTAAQKKLVQEHQSRLDKDIDAALSGEWKARIAVHEAAMAKLRAETPDVPRGYFLYEPSPDVPPTRLLKRGNPATPGDIVAPAVPSVLVETQPLFLEPTGFTTRRRLSLAKWMVGSDNPLAARVIVNRVWQWHFGEGLVRTPNDFGLSGRRPTHPELLDWLAHWFVNDAGWSLKKLHRLMMTSRTYQMSRDARREPLAEDPENRLLWRRAPRRLEVEAIRDSMLFVSGRLDRKMYGPPMYPYVPREALLNHADKTGIWPEFDEAAASRRTVYAFIKRSLLVPLLEVLDLCDVTQTSPRRSVTTVPTQALTLYNGEFVLRQSRHFAERLVREAGRESSVQIDLAFRLALSRTPTAAERTAMERFFDNQYTELQASHSETSEPELRKEALVQLCRVVFNLNEFVYPD